MHIQIFFTLMILTIIVSGTAFAEDSLISVQTDDNDYDEGDTILKYGHDIGKVVKSIKKGEHVHVHNVKTKKW